MCVSLTLDTARGRVASGASRLPARTVCGRNSEDPHAALERRICAFVKSLLMSLSLKVLTG